MFALADLDKEFGPLIILPINIFYFLFECGKMNIK